MMGLFLINSIALGAGLAMDAFSVSLANGLNEPLMRRRRMGAIAGCFALFQTVMPLIGYVCVRRLAAAFAAFQKWIPWIALGLLLLIGGKMVAEGLRTPKETAAQPRRLSTAALLLQGVATSIDALSVGFTIAALPPRMALLRAGLIGAVTFLICLGGLLIGRTAGTKLAGKATLLGGGILIAIGIEIFVTGILK